MKHVELRSMIKKLGLKIIKGKMKKIDFIQQLTDYVAAHTPAPAAAPEPVGDVDESVGEYGDDSSAPCEEARLSSRTGRQQQPGPKRSCVRLDSAPHARGRGRVQLSAAVRALGHAPAAAPCDHGSPSHVS